VATKLDFNLIPEYEFTATFMSLPRDIEAAIRQFPQTEERIEGALMFCARVMNCDPDKVPDAARKAGAYFRAALAEYASIEEAFNRERPAGTPEFRLHGTPNPLPHILKQLRHLQIHLVTNEMAKQTISLVLKNVPGAEPVDVIIWTIDDLTDAQFNELDAFKKKKHYTPAQATEMANWINTRQTQFGIHDLIHRGLVEAAERIVATYLPQAKGAGSPS
jgi:hypothetical protein